MITQALTGGAVVSDPLRDREYKRARRQISEGIHGAAVGASLLLSAALVYCFLPGVIYFYVVALSLGLFGIIKLFKSIGSILDAKVGPKLLDPALQPRATGSLVNSAPLPANPRVSQRLTADPSKPPMPGTRPVSLPDISQGPTNRLQKPAPAQPPTGRINREHSSPLRKLEKEDAISRLRN